MKEFIAACVQFAVAPNDVQANIEKGVTWLERAAREYEAELVVLPETVTTGFETGLAVEDLWDQVDEVPGRITRDIQLAARSLGVHVVWGSYRRGPERGVIYNSADRMGELLASMTRLIPLRGNATTVAVGQGSATTLTYLRRLWETLV